MRARVYYVVSRFGLRPGTTILLLALLAVRCADLATGEGTMSDGMTLHNGIRLPGPWPPGSASLSLEPQAVPYLEAPPDIIPIHVGRQLFVDDFLIEQTTLERICHRPVYRDECPVLKPEQPWELGQPGRRQGPMAMPFSDGVWYDPSDHLFKMWYQADYGRSHLCYAQSRDGIHWDKPSLDVRPGTNIVLENAGGARVVWLDLNEKAPSRRVKLITTRGAGDLIKPDQAWWGSKCRMSVHFSPDGIHWSDEITSSGPTGDRNSAFYDPFRQVWVMSIRSYVPFGGLDYPMRCRQYWETADPAAGLDWEYGEPPMWVGADNLDLRRESHRSPQPELYNLDAVGYESLMLGLFTVWHGGSNIPEGRPKPNDLCVGFSRDGWNWQRPDRNPFLALSEERGDWNWGNVSSAGGCCLVVGDKLYFYMSGRSGAPDNSDAGCATGLATLRRDGFASMHAGKDAGTLLTRRVRFAGGNLFVNAATAAGELRVEVLDRAGNVIAPFSADNCVPISTDSTLTRVTWRSTESLERLAGVPVRFRFHLREGDLYSFWVSPDESGASYGYVAAGGPGLPGNMDTVGIEAYLAAEQLKPVGK